MPTHTNRVASCVATLSDLSRPNWATNARFKTYMKVGITRIFLNRKGNTHLRTAFCGEIGPSYSLRLQTRFFHRRRANKQFPPSILEGLWEELTASRNHGITETAKANMTISRPIHHTAHSFLVMSESDGVGRLTAGGRTMIRRG